MRLLAAAIMAAGAVPQQDTVWLKATAQYERSPFVMKTNCPLGGAYAAMAPQQYMVQLANNPHAPTGFAVPETATKRNCMLGAAKGYHPQHSIVPRASSAQFVLSPLEINTTFPTKLEPTRFP